jgi:tetratricopeptide (TPR) repeat protein
VRRGLKKDPGSRSGSGLERSAGGERRGQSGRSTDRIYVWLCAACIAGGVLLAYGNSLAAPFIFDDHLSVLDNPSIQAWSQTRAILSPRRELPTAGRPLVNLSFAANYAVGGVSVTGYHIVNIAVHLFCALLLFGIVRRTLSRIGRPPSTSETMTSGPSIGLAFAVALIWAVHPLTTDAVTYITQRTELLMAVCYLLTLYGSIRASQSGRVVAWSAVAWSALAVTACAAGMACKESMVSAPLMVMVYDAVFGEERFGRTLRRRRWFYTALAATWLILMMVSSGARIHSAGFGSGVSVWTYLLNQAIVIPRYLGLAFWPRSLVLLYGAPQPLSVGAVWPQLLLVALLVATTALFLVRAPRVGFLGLWFFVTLAPTSSIIPIATEVAAERRMYLPLMAVVVLTAIAVRQALFRPAQERAVVAQALQRRVKVATLVLACCALSLTYGTWSRNRVYASPVLLAQTSVERYPSAVGRHALGVELIKAGRAEEGFAVLREAAGSEPRAHYSLGVELFRRKRWDEAIPALDAFVRLQPSLLEAVTARQLLGRAFAAKGQWRESIEPYRLVLRMNPTTSQRVETEGLLGEALFRTEQYGEAAEVYRRYLTAKPDDVIALTNHGVALVTLGRLPEATAAFQHIVDTSPDNWEGRRNLAAALSDAGDSARALPHAEKAAALRPDDAATHLLLAEVLAANGRMRDAQTHINRAAELDPALIRR